MKRTKATAKVNKKGFMERLIKCKELMTEIVDIQSALENHKSKYSGNKKRKRLSEAKIEFEVNKFWWMRRSIID